MLGRVAAAVAVALAILLSAPPTAAVAANPTVALEFATAPDGRFLPVIRVSINGSPELRMLADTGSNVLVTFPGALDGVTTPVDNTGIAHTANYTGTQAVGTIAGATVTVQTSLGAVSTADPVWFVDATSCGPQCLGDAIDAHLDGIFGLSQGRLVITSGVDSFELFSPLAQLPGSDGEGYTVRLTESGGDLELGRPTEGPDDVVLQQPLESGTYPTGLPIYFKCVPLCFQVGGVGSCLGTTVDSGEFTASLMGAQFVGSPNITFLAHPVHVPGVDITKEGAVNSGIAIGLAKGASAAPFAQWLTGAEPHQMEYYSTTGTPFLNTGNGFFIGRPIGFDNTNGHVVIGVSGLAPSAPSASATGGVGAVEVRWAAASGPSAVVGYVVTVLRDGAIIAQMTVGADARSAAVSGLAAGPATVIVVALTRFAGGPATAVEVTVSALPATGFDAMTWLASAFALIGVGGWVSSRRRRRIEN